MSCARVSVVATRPTGSPAAIAAEQGQADLPPGRFVTWIRVKAG